MSVKRKHPVFANGLICAGFRPFRAGCHQPEGRLLCAELAYALPALPGFNSPRPKTYAAWPVWRDSPDAESFRFVPLPKKEAARRWHKARRFDRQTHTARKHGGNIGRTALAVFYVLLFDFLDFDTGQLDPSYDAIAAKAGVCRRAVAGALQRLKALGLLHWRRRSREDKDAGGGFRRVQETNAYAVLSPSHWRGYHEPPRRRRQSREHGAITRPCQIRSRRPKTSCATASAERRSACSTATPATSWRDRSAGLAARSSASNSRNFRECRLCQEPLSLLRMTLCGAP